MNVFTIVIAGAMVVLCLFIIYGIGSIKRRTGASATVTSAKKRNAIIRDASRKLAQNPHNISALNDLSDLYYREHLWDKAFPLFDLMLNLAANNKEIDPF